MILHLELTRRDVPLFLKPAAFVEKLTHHRMCFEPVWGQRFHLVRPAARGMFCAMCFVEPLSDHHTKPYNRNELQASPGVPLLQRLPLFLTENSQ